MTRAASRTPSSHHRTPGTPPPPPPHPSPHGPGGHPRASGPGGWGGGRVGSGRVRGVLRRLTIVTRRGLIYIASPSSRPDVIRRAIQGPRDPGPRAPGAGARLTFSQMLRGEGRNIPRGRNGVPSGVDISTPLPPRACENVTLLRPAPPPSIHFERGRGFVGRRAVLKSKGGGGSLSSVPGRGRPGCVSRSSALGTRMLEGLPGECAAHGPVRARGGGEAA